ncbi:hypothetical protein [Teredinibacter turnerae]|uniref:hypothetical protein n=1 Tax=Teredinibacter turnerae TaxID=2426 RepID=UPI0012F99630|nr:hypothetical protein [Teredinibacter turnerae]
MADQAARAQEGGRSSNAARLRERQHQALLKGAQDGHITLAEANAWRAEGSGNPLTADLSRIDLSQVSASEFPNGVGSTESIDLFLRSADGNVYGHINLTLISPTEVIAQTPDVCDFFYGRNNNSLANVAANAANLVGEIHANSYSMPGRTPADFRINFSGVGVIQP